MAGYRILEKGELIEMGDEADASRSYMEITKYQRELMDHALGHGIGRNFYGTNFGLRDSDEFEKLVKLGYATKKLAPDWMGDDVIYYVSRKGLDAMQCWNKNE